MTMASEGSITRCLGPLKDGDPAAAQKIWESYFRRLVGLARQRLRGAPRRAADEEDVALSALDSVFRGVERGQFPRLHDRDDLWQVLALVTARKAIDLTHHERRQKRGGGAAAAPDEAGPPGPDNPDSAPPRIEQVVARDPTPEFAAQVAEACGVLLDRLGDDVLRSVALWKLECYTNDEIAAKLDCDRRAVERKLRMIRTLWQKEPGR
ncbi:MAG TPA: ECF-type sigma factor [Isosphaeraceae bacterium]|jgi:DNA-directed RNA polymerase specialized sigma24 family protein